jgi:HEAT repeats
MHDEALTGIRTVLWAGLISLLASFSTTTASAQEERPTVRRDKPSSSVPRPDVLEKVRRLLISLRSPASQSPGQVTRMLVRLGPEVVSCLELAESEFSNADHIEAIAEALAQVKFDKVEPYLFSVLSRSPSARCQIAAYEMLAEHAGPGAVTAVIDLMPTNPPRIMKRIETSLVELLSRHDTAAMYANLGQQIQSLEGDTAYRVLSCVANAGSAHGLSILGDRLGMDSDLDLVLVSGIARMGVESEDGGIVMKLRSTLESRNSNLRRECAMALGIFRVGEAVETLIELLGDEDAGVKNSAHWSLKAISKLNLPPEPAAWRLWYAKEEEWWAGDGQVTLRRLDSGSPSEVVDAIRMLAVRPLFARRIRARLEALAESDSDLVREAAIAALGDKKVPASRRSSGGSPGPLGFGGRPVAKAAPVGPVQLDPEPEPKGRRNITLIFAGILLLLVLYVSGVLHPDRIRGWFGSRT